MTKLAPEWVRTSDPVIRSPARYRWTTAPARINHVDHLVSICHVYCLPGLINHLLLACEVNLPPLPSYLVVYQCRVLATVGLLPNTLVESSRVSETKSRRVSETKSRRVEFPRLNLNEKKPIYKLPRLITE